jgi:hypothetical protein
VPLIFRKIKSARHTRRPASPLRTNRLPRVLTEADERLSRFRNQDVCHVAIGCDNPEPGMNGQWVKRLSSFLKYQWAICAYAPAGSIAHVD